MESTESSVTEMEDRIADLSKEMHTRPRSERQQYVVMVGQLVTMLDKLLTAAQGMTVPVMADPEAYRLTTTVMDDHKQWAILQQARLGALEQLNDKAFTTLSTQAEQVASQEAVHLMMLSKVVNLSPK
jgi:ferritin-like metal-binding protein YciE